MEFDFRGIKYVSDSLDEESIYVELSKIYIVNLSISY